MEPITILLIDDEDIFRQALVRRLSRRGMTCREASSGEAALSLLESEKVDVVICDVKMPGMGGIEALKAMKQQYPEMEVILLTGHANAADGVEGIRQGAFDYLTKPVELEHLVGKIGQAHDKILRLQEKRSESAFREKMEKQMIVADRLAALGTLATGVAHEINNPLAIIGEAAGWLGLILKKEEMADIPRKADMEKALAKIETGVHRARRITHQLLGFVREGDETCVREVDLEKLAQETLEMSEREMYNRKIRAKIHAEPNLTLIWSDPNPIRQVLANLVGNAIHAVDADGEIGIELEGTPDGARIRVKDTGSGIPGESLEKIFEPFFTTKPPGKGTGLGLYVSRGIVEKLGGSISVTSRPGKGTTFTIDFPRKAKERPEAVCEYPDGQFFS